MNILVLCLPIVLILSVMGETYFTYCDLEKTVCKNRTHVGCFKSERLQNQAEDKRLLNIVNYLIDKNCVRFSSPVNWNEELQMLSAMVLLKKFKETNKFCLSSAKFLDVRAVQINGKRHFKHGWDYTATNTHFQKDCHLIQSIGCSVKSWEPFSFLCLYNYSNRSTLQEYISMTEDYKRLRLHFNINRNDIVILYLANGLVWIGNLILLIFFYAAHRYEHLRLIYRGSYN